MDSVSAADPTPLQPTGARAWRWLDALAGAMVVVAVLAHPTQVTIPLWLETLDLNVPGALQKANLTVSSALLLAAFPLYVIAQWFLGRLGRCVRNYPASLLALLVVAAVSAVPVLKPAAARVAPAEAREHYVRAARELVQLGVFFVCGYVMLADYLGRRAWRERILTGFYVAVALALFVGLNECAHLRPPSPEMAEAGALISPMDVDGSFGFVGRAAGAKELVGTASSRSVMAAWLTLVVPLLVGVGLFARGWKAAVPLALTAVAGLLFFHGGLWMAAMAAVLAVACARGPRWLAATAVAMLLFYTAVFNLAPQKQGHVLLDSLMLRTQTDRFRTLSLYGINPELDESGRGADLAAMAPDADRVQAPPLQQKYAEWQPALLGAAHSPVFGLGLGSYQKRIGAFYELPEDPDLNPDRTYRIGKLGGVNLMEKDANPFYAVWLLETGFAGLLAFACVVMAFARRGVVNAQLESSPVARGLRLGACAALGAMAVGCLFTNYWVRGVGPAFVFVLALCAAAPLDPIEPETALSDEVTVE